MTKKKVWVTQTSTTWHSSLPQLPLQARGENYRKKNVIGKLILCTISNSKACADPVPSHSSFVPFPTPIPFHSTKNKEHFQRSGCSSTGSWSTIPWDTHDYHAPCKYDRLPHSLPLILQLIWTHKQHDIQVRARMRERQESNNKHGQTGPRAKQKMRGAHRHRFWPLNNKKNANACVIFIHVLVACYATATDAWLTDCFVCLFSVSFTFLSSSYHGWGCNRGSMPCVALRHLTWPLPCPRLRLDPMGYLCPNVSEESWKKRGIKGGWQREKRPHKVRVAILVLERDWWRLGATRCSF